MRLIGTIQQTPPGRWVQVGTVALDSTPALLTVQASAGPWRPELHGVSTSLSVPVEGAADLVISHRRFPGDGRAHLWEIPPTVKGTGTIWARIHLIGRLPPDWPSLTATIHEWTNAPAVPPYGGITIELDLNKKDPDQLDFLTDLLHQPLDRGDGNDLNEPRY